VRRKHWIISCDFKIAGAANAAAIINPSISAQLLGYWPILPGQEIRLSPCKNILRIDEAAVIGMG